MISSIILIFFLANYLNLELLLSRSIKAVSLDARQGTDKAGTRRIPTYVTQSALSAKDTAVRLNDRLIVRRSFRRS